MTLPNFKYDNNSNKSHEENLLNTCITDVSKILADAGWRYRGGILAVTEDSITVDPDFLDTTSKSAIRLAYPDKKIVAIQKLRSYNLSEFLSLSIPPRENIIERWLPCKGLAMLYAPRGIGKTFFALTLGVAVATGGQCLVWNIPTPRGVLYLDGEMPAATIQERLARLVINNETELSAPFRFITKDQNSDVPFDLANQSFQYLVDVHLEGIELIIVDNISTICHVKENDAQAWEPIQEWALQMRIRGISVLFIHHAGKGGQQRGTSKREDILDTVISLRRPADYSPTMGAVFELHFEKSRGFSGNEAESVQLTLTDGEGKIDWYVETVEQSTFDRVVTLKNEGLSPKEIAEELGINKSSVSRHLKKAKQESRTHVV